MIIHTSIKDWTQDLMEAHQSFNHQTILGWKQRKIYNSITLVVYLSN
jgi:hypothetical protein